MMSCGCRFDEDGPDDDGDDEVLDFYIDANGDPTERVRMGDQEVVIHYADVPESDITTVQGIRVTTPLRTVIDIAPDLGADHLDRIVQDCLRRRLFTTEEALARLAQPDMQKRPGAALLQQALRR
jgi:hypothetical protein